MAKQDARMGTSHFQVPGPDGQRGFGGTCFPKDTHSLYCQMNAHGVAPYVYPAILTRNDTVDRPEREWSRDIWRTTIPLPTPASKVVVVFSDGGHASSAPGSSSYLTDVIRTNLAKNHVVIQVVRGGGGGESVSLSTHHIIKRQTDAGTPLFFPRVDECYYSAHRNDTTYDTMRGVMNIIDLWNSHKEMILYVVKPSVVDETRAADADADEAADAESGTEGFDSDADADPYDTAPPHFDYAMIIEEHFRLKLSVIPNQKRGLVVLF